MNEVTNLVASSLTNTGIYDELASKYERCRYERVKKYGFPFQTTARHVDAVDTLRRDYVAELRGFFSPQELAQVRGAVQRCLEEPASIVVPRKVRGNESLLVQARRSYDSLLAFPRISAEEHAGGEAVWRVLTKYVQIRDPLLRIPEILKLATQRTLLACVQDYLECFPALVYVKVVKTYANDLPAIDTQLFHADLDAARNVKVFVYLDDVDLQSGPTTVVKGTNIFKQPELRTLGPRSELATMVKLFGEERVTPLIGKVGDIFLCDTAALHCGLVATGKDRLNLILTFGAHPEGVSGGDMRISAGTLRQQFEIDHWLLEFARIV